MNPHPDALRAAGFYDCHLCGALTFPTDATWLIPRTLLIANFDPACPHVPGGTVTLDPTSMDIASRCVGTTLAGTRCARRAGCAGGYCHLHNPSRRPVGGEQP